MQKERERKNECGKNATVFSELYSDMTSGNEDATCSKIKKIHTPHEEAAASASSSAAAAAAAAEQEPAILVDVVSAPLHEATVTETFEKSFDLSFGEKNVEAGLQEQRVQRVAWHAPRGACRSGGA